MLIDFADKIHEQMSEDGKSLYLSSQGITTLNKIHYISKLKENLEILWLDGNDIASLNGVQCLQMLKQLNIDYCKVGSLVPISSLTNLEEITADSNFISDIQPLRQLTNLKVVDLSFNQIESLETFQHLLKLETLDLDKNRISNIQQLKYLQKLPVLLKLCLKSNLEKEDNPICQIDCYRLKALKYLPKSLQCLDHDGEDFIALTDEEKELLCQS